MSASSTPLGPPPALPPWRRLLPIVATAVYVAAASLRATGGRGLQPWLLGAVAVAVAWRAARRPSAVERAAGTGLAMLVASLGAPLPPGGSVPATFAWLEVFGCIGAAVAALAARRALRDIPTARGLGVAAPTSSLFSMLLLSGVWCVAVVAAVVSASSGAIALSPRLAALGRHGSILSLAASVMSLAVLLASTLRASVRRRLEMGVAPRLSAIVALIGIVTLLAVVVGFMRVGAPQRVAKGALGVAAAGIVWIALHPDGVVIARLARRVLVLAFIGGGIILLGASAADGSPRDAMGATIATGIAALVIGVSVRLLEDPLRPARGAWLDSVAKARELLMHAEPEEAIREMLFALRAPAGPSGASPELWTFEPNRCTSIDAAGYLREREAELLPQLVTVAAAQPEAILRAEVLDSLVVRRPDLRPLARWLDDHGALLAVVVTRKGEPEGLLVLPRGARHELLTLEEARAIKELADALAAVCHVRAAHARMFARERDATLRAERAEELVEQLRHELSIDAERTMRATARLAQPASIGTYAPASRLALDALERRTAVGGPMVVFAPSGVDPVPFLARAHLKGVRARGPFVVVDGASSLEHEIERWTNADTSPLSLAHKGMLVLLEGAALPLEVQRLIGQALAERRPPWERAEPLDVQLALTSARPIALLVEAGLLDGALAARLADALRSPVSLPRLRERPEDLRAIITDRVAREALRVKGEPVGIEPAAYARLVEYPFEGEDAELTSIIHRAVARCQGSIVRLADLEAVLEAHRAPENDDLRSGRERRADGPSDSEAASRKTA